MVRACRVCQGEFTMQGFMILAIIGTEKLIVDKTDGLTDGKLNSNIAPCYKQVR